MDMSWLLYDPSTTSLLHMIVNYQTETHITSLLITHVIVGGRYATVCVSKMGTVIAANTIR